jgi:hypothetical protein
MKTVLEPKPRISAMPEDDLDELRTAAAQAAGRLLSALHGRQARARAELDRLEAEIAALETIERGVRDIAARSDGLAAADRHYLDGPLPNGFHYEVPKTEKEKLAVELTEYMEANGYAITAAEAVTELPEPARPRGQNPGMAELKPDGGTVDVQAAKPTDAELRGTAIVKIFEGLHESIASQLADDFAAVWVEDVDDLVEATTVDSPRFAIEDMCSVPDHVKFVRQQLRLFFQRAGFAAVNLNADGLPKAWLAEEYTAEGDGIIADSMPAMAKPPLPVVTPKPKKVATIKAPAAEMTDAEIDERAKKEARRPLKGGSEYLDVNMQEAIANRLRGERYDRLNPPDSLLAAEPDTGTVAGREARDAGPTTKPKSKKTATIKPPEGFGSWCDMHEPTVPQRKEMAGKWTAARLFENAQALLGIGRPDMGQLGRLRICTECWAMRPVSSLMVEKKEADACPHCKSQLFRSYNDVLTRLHAAEAKPAPPPVPAADLTDGKPKKSAEEKPYGFSMMATLNDGTQREAHYVCKTAEQAGRLAHRGIKGLRSIDHVEPVSREAYYRAYGQNKRN